MPGGIDAYISGLVAFVVVIAAFIGMMIKKIPFYSPLANISYAGSNDSLFDLESSNSLPLHSSLKESIKLIKREEGNIEGRFLRRDAIDNASNADVKMVAGEFGPGLRDTAAYALKKGKSLILISGPHASMTKGAKHAIKILSKKYPYKFKYMQLNKRPDIHFTLFGETGIFIEKPHNHKDLLRESWMITNPNYINVISYTDLFFSELSKAKPINLFSYDANKH